MSTTSEFPPERVPSEPVAPILAPALPLPVAPVPSAPDAATVSGASGPKRPRKGLVWTVILGVALLAAVGVLTFFVLSFIETQRQLEDANTKIEEQERRIEEQRTLIEKKETFGAAMQQLLDKAGQFDGVLVHTIVPFEDYEREVARAWTQRWDPEAMDRRTAAVHAATAELDTRLTTAATEAATNSSGSKYEEVIDRLGEGFVTSVIGDADGLCGSDVLGCVGSESPTQVYFDAADDAQPYSTDWLRTGIAYHEFAHVLQYTNPGPTETAAAAFGGDWETMADCFALTYLDGWTLDHEIWVSDFEYWEVSIGYGYTCNDAQRQVIRDWYGQLGFHVRPISQ